MRADASDLGSRMKQSRAWGMCQRGRYDIEGKVMRTVASCNVHFLSEADSRQNVLDC